MKSRAITLLCLALLAPLGCGRQQTAWTQAEHTQAEPSAFKRLFIGSEVAPQYGWDGQTSSTLVAFSADIAMQRARSTLTALGFTIEETRRQQPERHIRGTKEDHMTAEVWVVEKPPEKVEVKAKVGALGDRSSSEHILEEIQKQSAPTKKSSQH